MREYIVLFDAIFLVFVIVSAIINILEFQLFIALSILAYVIRMEIRGGVKRMKDVQKEKDNE